MVSKHVTPTILLTIVFTVGIICFLVGRTLFPNTPTVQAQVVGAGSSYDYDVIATLNAGPNSIEYVSINDGAFITETSTVAWNEHRPDLADRLLVSDGTAAATEVDTSFPGGEFEGLQINNENNIVAMDNNVRTGGTDFWRIVRLDTDPATERDIIATSTADPNVDVDFNVIFDHPSINNSGEIVFLASGGRDSRSTCGDNDNCLVRPNPTTGAIAPFIEIGLSALNIPEPRIADNGLIVLRDGGFAADTSIRIYNRELTNSEDIATTVRYFSQLGARPGMSDDGSIVVFYGDLTIAGAIRYDTTPGPGIFASIAVGNNNLGAPQAGIRQPNPDLTAPRIIKRVAGVGNTLSAFEPDERINVNNLHQVAYIAYDTANQKGIYTSQLNLFSANFTVSSTITDTQTTIAPPALVAGQGITITNVGQIQDVAIYDSLNDKGEVAFWASTGTQETVIRARGSCPGSDYSTPLENTYINQYDAGTEYNLPIRFGDQGGNSCGASSLTMAVNAINYTRGITERLDIETVFNATMQQAMPVPAETSNLFVWGQGRQYIEQNFGTTLDAAVIFGKAAIDNALDQGYPVLASTRFTSQAWGNFGGGHVVLFWGRTSAGDYIVSDPAGNHWESNTGHYGVGECGGYKLYPEANIAPYLQTSQGGNRPALVICPTTGACPPAALPAQQQAAATSDLAPSSVDLEGKAVLFAGWPGDDGSRQFYMWLEDAEGRRTGYLPDGSRIAEIPESEAAISPVSITAPDAPGDGDEPLSETWPYTLLVENLDEVQVFVSGIEDTSADITMIAYNTGDSGIERQDTSSAVQQGETTEIDFTAPPSETETPTAGPSDIPTIQPTIGPGPSEEAVYLPLLSGISQANTLFMMMNQPTAPPTPQTPTVTLAQSSSVLYLPLIGGNGDANTPPPDGTPTPQPTSPTPGPTRTPAPAPGGPTPEPIGQGFSAPVEAVYGLGDITALAFGSDDETALVGGSTGQAALIDPLTGEISQRYSGHTAAVNAVAFSPDGQYVVTGSADETARLWERDTGRLLRLFAGHGGAVYAVAVSPDGSRILTGAATSSGTFTDYVRLWDAETGETVRTFEGHTSTVQAVAFSPDGTQALTGSEDALAKLWNVATGEEIRTLSGHGSIVAGVAFSPDGTQALTGGSTTARLWNLSTGGSRTIDAHSFSVNAVAFSPDGTRLLTGGAENGSVGNVKLWDTEGNLLHTFSGHSRPALAVAFSPDGGRALTGSEDGSIRLWDARVPTAQSVPHPDDVAVKAVSFTPNGAQLLTGDANGVARLWDNATGAEVRSFSGHTRPLEAVDLTADGRYALTAANTDTDARIWDVGTGAEVVALEHPGNQYVYDAVFSTAGDQVLTGSGFGTAYLWDWDSEARTSTLVHTLDHESNNSVTSVAISPDGSQLATVSFQTMSLWDAVTGNLIRTFSSETGGTLTAVAFSPDGAWLALTEQPFTVRLWQINTGASRVFETPPGARTPDSVAFSPDGSRLVADGVLQAFIWDAASGNLINVLQAHEAQVNEAVFSPDGSQVATASDDGTARVWDAAAGSTLYTTTSGHTDSVQAVDYFSDGSTLVSGGWDGTLKLWDTATSTVRRTLRGHRRSVSAVDVSANDRFIASGGQSSLLLWDAQSGLLLRSFTTEVNDAISGVALSPNGALLAAGGVARTLYLYDTETGEELRRFEGHTSAITSVAFAPDGSRLLSGSADGSALLWDVNDETVTLASFSRGQNINAVAFSADGERVATGDTQGAVVWDVSTAQEVARLDASNSPNIAAVAFAPDGTRLLTARGPAAELWDIESGNLLRSFTGHNSGTAGNPSFINTVAFAPNGVEIATGGARGNNSVRLWEVTVRSAIRSFDDPDGSGYASVAASADGQRVATGNCDATAYLWNATTGTQLRSIPGFPGISGPGGGPCVTHLGFSPDGSTLLGGTNTTVRLHDVSSGEARRTFTPHRYAVFDARFSSDGSQILTAGGDKNPIGCLEECGEAKLWDPASGDLLATFTHDPTVAAAALSPDGRYLVTTSNYGGEAWLWDVTNTAAPILELNGSSAIIENIAFSPDGGRILGGNRGGTALLWDSVTGAFLYSFNHGVYNQSVRSVAFANTQPWLVTTSEQTAYVWHSETGELLFAVSDAGRMGDAAFTPDDRYLFTGNASGAAKLWQTAAE